jgi:hypothetical protein
MAFRACSTLHYAHSITRISQLVVVLRNVGLQVLLIIPSTLLRLKIDQRIYQLQLWLLNLLQPLNLRIYVAYLSADVFHLSCYVSSTGTVCDH